MQATLIHITKIKFRLIFFQLFRLVEYFLDILAHRKMGSYFYCVKAPLEINPRYALCVNLTL